MPAGSKILPQVGDFFAYRCVREFEIVQHVSALSFYQKLAHGKRQRG
jgi:hypothetical protein